MKNSSKSKHIDTIFVMVVFCIFAVSVLIVLTLSAGIYQRMTDISRDRDDERTILSYIWTKTKSADDAGMIHIGDFNGVSALFYDEIINDTLYRTAIYVYDGWVRELFSNPAAGLAPQDGARLIKLDNLSFEVQKNGIIVAQTENLSLMLFPRARTYGEAA
ncbi:MAG: DUF4860 domain-containing protein [Oscillospiraceae bacterium]|nr:DUF4860 domain-containing protein [Oscillospiraceae bacterium]